MSATLIYAIYNIAIALIYSIGKKWYDELNKIEESIKIFDFNLSEE